MTMSAVVVKAWPLQKIAKESFIDEARTDARHAREDMFGVTSRSHSGTNPKVATRQTLNMRPLHRLHRWR